MRTLAIAVFGCLLSTQALAGPVTAAQKSVSEAIAAVRATGGECKKTALSPLKDARDHLDTAKRNRSEAGLQKARRAVEDALDESQGCEGDADEKMRMAWAAMNSMMDAAATAAATPSPAEKQLQEKRQCWNYRNDWSTVDPGCHVTWKGKYAMGKAAFIALENKLRNEKDRFQQEALLNRAFNWQKKDLLTARQLERLLGHIRGDVDRLEAVKKLAKHVVDMENGSRVGRMFKEARARRDALEEFNRRRY